MTHHCISTHVTITPVDSVRVLGVQLDCEVNMREHIGMTAASCLFHLRRLRQLRHIVNQYVMKRLVCTYILTRLDYCNCVLAELQAKSLKPLERVMNAAARLGMGLQPRDHITEAMHNLHWLPLTFRIKYKLCLMMYAALNGRCPTYINNIIIAGIAVNETHLTATGIRMPMGSHGITRHPTEATSPP